jgi:ketosteroid isomerase-like protein
MSRRWLLPGALVLVLVSAGCFSVGTMLGREQVVATTAQLNDARAIDVNDQKQLHTVTAELNSAQPIVDVYYVKQVEVTFHQALATKDVDLMMSIFADNAVMTAPNGDVYRGKPAIRTFYATQAPAMQPQNHWAALVPAYKIGASINGVTATLTFECHLVDIATNQMKVHHQVDMTLERQGVQWMVKTMKSTAIQLT